MGSRHHRNCDGKPVPEFFRQIVASTPHEAQDCLMVGDDVEGDVTGAIRAGLQGCLLRTGKFQTGDEGKLPDAPRIIDSVDALFSS